jgi:hypothetical protein
MGGFNKIPILLFKNRLSVILRRSLSEWRQGSGAYDEVFASQGLYSTLQSIYQQGNASTFFNLTNNNVFTWSGASGYWGNGGWHITSSGFTGCWTCFQQTGPTINISGRKLRLRYKSTTAVGNGIIQFKQYDPLISNLHIRFSVYTIPLQNTDSRK